MNNSHTSSQFRRYFSFSGRLRRSSYTLRIAVLALGMVLASLLLEQLAVAGPLVLLVYGLAFWCAAALTTQRWHDINRSWVWLALPAIPVLGPLWAGVELFLRRGTRGPNRFGDDPRTVGLDYQQVDTGALTTPGSGTVINDVTGLNPIPVLAVSTPTTVEEVVDALKCHQGPVSIGGGHFSMGGQTASPGSLHLDLRKLNQILWFSPSEKRIRVQSGVRWCDIQKFIDPHDLSLRIMQTYANFTVGGSLSVNVHGRYVGQGPLVLSVESIRVALADGGLVNASREQSQELFYGAIGGYGGLGVIVEAELSLTDNTRVERVSKKLPIEHYPAHFGEVLNGSRVPVFHNGDIFPPHYRRVRSVTWFETDKAPSEPERLMPIKRSYWLHRYLFWAFTETPFGKWRREYLIEPLEYLSKRIHYRNYEAGYNVAELEPGSRAARTYVLQEYFVPIARFSEFVDKAREILQRHRVNVVNISIRHAKADDGTLLAWAREEVFAFVLYYKQRTRDNAKGRVAVWTRELIDAVIDSRGTYYLPYQIHATEEQFHRAYPRAKEYFALKQRLDPKGRFRNALWDKYYSVSSETEPELAAVASSEQSDFRAVLLDTEQSDAFYRFLQNVFRLYPEDRFHQLLVATSKELDSDEAIYRSVQGKLPSLKPVGAEVTHALPALARQKNVMTGQTREIVGERKAFEGYIEIGTTGRYISRLMDELEISGPLFLLHDSAPTNSPADVAERGQLKKVGQHVPIRGYAPIREEDIASNSVDLVTCYIGLHHAEPSQLSEFVASIFRVLRPGGIFILRDHDVTDAQMNTFVSLVHTVFNLGTDEPWEVDAAEPRFFRPVSHWVSVLEGQGFRDLGFRLLQDNDPSLNTLMGFEKVE